MKKLIQERILSTCGTCGGRGIVPSGHVTRKRNSKPCPECKENENPGEVEKVVTRPG